MSCFRIALLAAVSTLAVPIFADDFPPAFHLPSGYHELTANRQHYAFASETFEDRGADGKLHAKAVEGEWWRLDLRPDTKQDGPAVMRDLEVMLRGDGWTIIRAEGALEAKKSIGGTLE